MAIAIFIAFASFDILAFNLLIDNGRSFAAISAGVLTGLSLRFRRFAERAFLPSFAIILCTVAFLRFPLPAHLNLVYFSSVTVFLVGAVIHSYRLRPFIPMPLFESMAFLGTISYSVYIWQQIFIPGGGGYPRPSILAYPALIIPFALASYYLIERPFARMSRARFSARRH